jgi:transcriptional regulator with XRE-family HTH domain
LTPRCRYARPDNGIQTVIGAEARPNSSGSLARKHRAGLPTAAHRCVSSYGKHGECQWQVPDGTAGMTGDGSPTVRRRVLAAMLREARQAAGMTIEQVGALLLCSPTKISRMETAQRGASPRDVRDLSTIYGIPDDRRDQLMELSRQSRQRAWWQTFDLPDRLATYIGLESAASSLKIFKSVVVPGLLQSADYARAVIEGTAPKNFDRHRVDQQISARAQRQLSFDDRSDHPTVHVVLDEACLSRVVGSRAVMAGQLGKLIELAARDNFTIQVISFATGAHQGMESNFDIFQFHDGLVGDIAYTEGMAGGQYFERPADVGRFQRAFQSLTETALDPDETSSYLKGMHRSYQSDH